MKTTTCTAQPKSRNDMTPDDRVSIEEKSHSNHHHKCHTSRMKRRFIPIILGVVVMGLILIISLFDGGLDAGLLVEGGSLLKRQNGGSIGNGNRTQAPFIKNKLYLIVVIVGFFVVVILGIMLSAWCCKGSFQNPLCCPCYLCACCGGLACLECIGCGLCAEGLNDINV